ncbi:hypothetical protein RQP46_000427 [Phenoliferia psychrophenolica]
MRATLALQVRQASRSVGRSPALRSGISSSRTKEAPAPPHLNVLAHAKNLTPARTSLKGRALLNHPPLNKGAAFTREERVEFGLEGLLPFECHDLDAQCDRAYNQLSTRSDSLSKYTFLASLRDQNHVLYYNLILRHLSELLPIIYTPTVGEAIQKYSTIWRRPDGLFLTYPDRAIMRELMLTFKKPKDGVGGVLISIGKSNIYTLGAGIDPSRVLPVVLDVGTDNQQLLNDPLYLGLRRSRMRGEQYDEFVDQFCQIVREWYPDAFLHVEDFGVTNAGRLLNKYRPLQSCFNGTAGLGIADGIRSAMMIEDGLTSEEARKRFWVLDRPGLLTTETPGLRPGQENFVRDVDEVTSWASDEKKGIELLEVIKQAKPTILIGCSTMAGAFNKSVIKEMAKHVERPIVFPLSNPTRLAEADPTTKLTDSMIQAGVSALAQLSPALEDQDKPLLPNLEDLRVVSVKVAAAVANAARSEGVSKVERETDWTEDEIREIQWDPVYRPLELVE